MTELFQRGVPTPIGELLVTATSSALRAIRWPDHPDGLVKISDTDLQPEDRHPDTALSLFAAVEEQFGQYFAGARTSFDLPLDPKGTDFQREVWLALRSIPYGETKTYGEQATSIGRPSAARAVGAANGKNPLSIVVPCHRVIGGSGALTGFAGGLSSKAFLLELESSQHQLW